jgi:putative lipase involved disintegration of autophagic bodies
MNVITHQIDKAFKDFIATGFIMDPEDSSYFEDFSNNEVIFTEPQRNLMVISFITKTMSDSTIEQNSTHNSSDITINIPFSITKNEESTIYRSVCASYSPVDRFLVHFIYLRYGSSCCACAALCSCAWP